jgi:hypothetical protein
VIVSQHDVSISEQLYGPGGTPGSRQDITRTRT